MLDPVPEGLRAWFTRARELGLLGPAAIDDHLIQAGRFRDALAGPEDDPPARVLDLGTGAGLPGLVLAVWWPDSSWVLLDGKEKRSELLGQAVSELGALHGPAGRVQVRCGRAEELAHESEWREQFDVVVARSFGPPAVTAECAAGFLRLDGRLAVSEPPSRDEGDGGPNVGAGRWEGAPVSGLGLTVADRVGSVQLLVKTAPTPTTYPRRTGVPAKRPLF